MRFTKEHEWVRLDGEVATIGISAYAAGQLGDIVFVELPEVGKSVAPGDGFAVVESVKAASDVYAPVAGVVAAVNAAITDTPEMVNQDPEGDGWLARLTLSDPKQLDALMDRPAYEHYLKGL